MIAIIGCGNLNRQDDGVGPSVIERLRSRFEEEPGVKLFDAGTDGMAVMFRARGCKTLIVVDASQMGVEAGAIHEIPGNELELEYKPGLNLHDFRWDAALHSGRQIFRDEFPEDVVVFLIEAKELGLGIGLSTPVSKAAGSVASRIAEIVGERLRGDGAD